MNQYIPMYITEQPWYWKGDGDNDPLSHQKVLKPDKVDLEPSKLKFYKAKELNKFWKGACTNCGSMDHKVKECCERPRKIGAKWTNEDIWGEINITGGHDYNKKLKFEEKRDGWAGYDPESYKEIVD